MKSKAKKSEPALNPRRRLIVTVVVVGGLLLALFWFVDLKTLHQQAERIPGLVVFAMVALLPLIGVPVTLVYVLAGAKFGEGWGLAAAGAAIVVHLLGSWWIGHSWLRPTLDALLRNSRFSVPKVPQGESVPACLFVSLVPGVPYTAKNYLLVLSGVPLRPYFLTCVPAHFVHAVLGVLFGHFSGELNTAKIVIIVVYGLVLAGLSHYLIRRLRRPR